MINKDFHISRRGFLRNTGLLAAATSLPAWVTQQCMAQDANPAATSPNEAIQVALIGCGGQGRGDARTAKGLGSIMIYLLGRINPKLLKIHIPLAVTGWVLILGLMLYATMLDIGRLSGGITA